MSLTTEQAAKFEAYVNHWKVILSLGDWRIAVSGQRTRHKVMAEISKIDLEQRFAVIKLGPAWGDGPITDKDINETAFHECFHIFLHELIETAKVPDQPIDTIRSAEHRVINVMERVLITEGADGP